ncbi:MAG TPA: VWA domain-containing protein [Baekduia sp.]|uniref:VWA domain-containing protein n=1 Tax=Baekduia sp. TaxID=2600305 RepID=UPI002D7A325E|nr:VWA domain-containing protein [Baekduia sp.]HET6508378.1 VWA domain-containing protein [Baekduia sp.]
MSVATPLALSFGAPLGLLALLAIPLALLGLYAARRRRTAYAVRFPAAGTLALAAGVVSPWRRLLPAALALAAIAALALALAKPQRTIAVPVEGASVVLVTDHSGSMSATDVEPDRLSAAETAAETFLDKLPKQTRVGVVAYSDGPDGTLPPTTDRDRVRGTIEAQTAAGATATGEALQVAIDTLAPGGDKSKAKASAIILLSDGKTTTGRDPVGVARIAKRLGIPIYTVALGTEDATIPNPVSPLSPPIAVPPDPETLKQIAQVSGGRAFTSDDAGELRGIYSSLGSKLATKHEQREITPGFAGAGLVLLIVAGLLSLPRLGRLP